MKNTSERFVRVELSPRAPELFQDATFRSPGCGPLYGYIPVSVAHIRSDCWELGFIPRKDILLSRTFGVFVYSISSNSLLGPFQCYFQNGRWELYLVSD